MKNKKRIKIFVIISLAMLSICLLRLVWLQLLSSSFYNDEITKLKLQRCKSLQLKTIRGKILDRNGCVLAVDRPQFKLCINYELSSVLDERIRKSRLTAGEDVQTDFENLQHIINTCSQFGVEPEKIKKRIVNINNRIWNLRSFMAWARNNPDKKILEKYNNKINSIPLSVAMADFENKFSENKRLELISRIVDIADLNKSWPLLELKTDDDIFAAQLEFLNTSGVEILPKAKRFYPYNSVAAQTIGWVGRPQESDKQLFADDKFANYLNDDVCGRNDGIEYVCETILRGRRGEIIYDIDRKIVSETQTQFGEDVRLTINIELQQKIENYLSDCKQNPNCKSPTSAVVIDVGTGEILALVSMPVFDLNRIRYDYGTIIADVNQPLRNRAINELYPPGSVVKPLILVAGLESGKINADEIISCPAQKAPRGWPNCWLHKKYSWLGHDDKWPNNASNAIKGSCNIYFSHLADRIKPAVLQNWLSKFGYGHEILDCRIQQRQLNQAAGIITSGRSKNVILPQEKRFFGIGQGNLRVTPIQVANSMATIARSGLSKSPVLLKKSKSENSTANTDIGISPQTLAVVRDGMSAVVNESGGTAYNEFIHANFAARDVKVYGKTGSTQNPKHAWFAGFAEDSKSRAIAIAVIVEGGQHGSSDAAPLARDIINFCIEAGHIGQNQFSD